MTDAREQLAKALDSSGDAGADWSEVQADAIAAFVEERVQTEALARHNQDLQRDKTILHHAERLRATEQQLEAVERRLDALDNTEDCYWSQGVEDDVAAEIGAIERAAFERGRARGARGGRGEVGFRFWRVIFCGRRADVVCVCVCSGTIR